MARLPRWQRSGAVFSETRRTVDRQFLLKPCAETRNIIGACLGRALAKNDVKLYWFEPNVNHVHDGCGAVEGKPSEISKFYQHFYSLLTRNLNKHWGREGTMWSSRVRSREAVDSESRVQQLLYAVTNMVKDGLLDRVSHNPGYSCYNALARGEVERFFYVDWTAWRKQKGPRSKRKKPQSFVKWVEVKYEPIPERAHLPEHERQALFRREVRKIEQEEREKRQKEGRTVMGLRKLEKLDERDRPKTEKPRTNQPLCHASSREAKEEYKKELTLFLDFFYGASGLYLEGHLDVEFPENAYRPPLLKPYRLTAT